MIVLYSSLKNINYFYFGKRKNRNFHFENEMTYNKKDFFK